jgi:SM-20-related protein
MSELKPAHRAFLPPHRVLRDFLAADTASTFLAYAVANEARFVAGRVGRDSEVISDTRHSLTLRDIGPFRAALSVRLAQVQAEMTAALGMPAFARDRFEFQLVAHGDGDFYGRHTDIGRPGDPTSARRRVLTGVYYLFAEPRRFSGGALRLHELMPRDDGPAQHIDVVPQNNACVFFPAWMPHEVMPAALPSGRFADARFSVNCWFHKPA